jgi:predicted metal-dependent HD superfamily phosphohydrolase
MLKNIFITLFLKYSGDHPKAELFWSEVETNYSGKNRHYHILAHLDNLFKQLSEVKSAIEDWDVLLFSMFYHDAIYKASRNDNEEKSAALAQQRLNSISFPQDRIAKCIAQILATKGHSESNDSDINFFTDADLSILGMDWNSYSDYYKQVRKEYSIYPNFMYIPGRKKVLNHFLSMKRIFKTDYFFDKFENAARTNLAVELKEL